MDDDEAVARARTGPSTVYDKGDDELRADSEEGEGFGWNVRRPDVKEDMTPLLCKSALGQPKYTVVTSACGRRKAHDLIGISPDQKSPPFPSTFDWATTSAASPHPSSPFEERYDTPNASSARTSCPLAV